MSEISNLDIRNVCVFCSSSERVKERYTDLANDLAAVFAQKEWALVYGGASGGIMGAVADAVLAQGLEVKGVIPDYLRDKEIAHEGLSELFVTQDMHERQMKMAQLSQAFIILPGGMGTLAEFFEVVTWYQLGLHEKPIFLVNADGYWDSLIAMLDKAESEGFVYGAYRDVVHIVEDVGQIADQV